MKDKICGYYLDSEQEDIVLDESKYLLVTAGAGSGKTLTILGKINYLIKYKHILPSDILCISFTRASAISLKEKILKEFKINMSVYTFHKLSLEILKQNNIAFEIADSNTLENIIHEFFLVIVLHFDKQMKDILQSFNIKPKKNIKEQYNKFYKYNYDKIQMLERLISTFLHLFKCNKFAIENFNEFLYRTKKQIFNINKKKEITLILLCLNIYLIYQQYLGENKEIDFDDMIIDATKLIQEKGILQRYKYIIIDEYQDTSYIRFELIKAIIEKTGAKLMAVGDDFQSIYRFTGCDVSLFLNFQKYFPNSKIMKIENTYRNSNQLVEVASKFILKNYNQIKKNLKSNKHLEKPIRVVYYDNIKKQFLKLILKIYNDTNRSILLLGRNNNDVHMILSDELKLNEDGTIIYKLNPSIKMYYLTMHKSKGLEEENVVIINLENKLLGIPNKIKDDKILNLVNRSYDKFPYSEERRLFYVALTRTKNYVYLLVPNKGKSFFVKELLQNKKHIEIEKIK